MGLFTKKPGGTLVGNLLRGVGKVASGVIAAKTGINLNLGSGKNMLPADGSNNSGQNLIPTNQPNFQNIGTAAQGLFGFGKDIGTTVQNTKTSSQIMPIVLMIAGILGIVLIFKSSKN